VQQSSPKVWKCSRCRNSKMRATALWATHSQTFDLQLATSKVVIGAFAHGMAPATMAKELSAQNTSTQPLPACSLCCDFPAKKQKSCLDPDSNQGSHHVLS
jgi:hypothetical protein